MGNIRAFHPSTSRPTFRILQDIGVMEVARLDMHQGFAFAPLTQRFPEEHFTLISRKH
jgi:hypothetical protein